MNALTPRNPRQKPEARDTRPSGRTRPADNLVRCAVAILRGQPGTGGPEAILQTLYPDDQPSPLLLRAATTPATLTGSAWADALATPSVSDFIATMGPASASSALFRSGLQVSLAGHDAVTIPSLVTSANGAAFVAEGAPIATVDSALDGPTLTGHKLAVIAAFTRETAEHTDIENIVRTVLGEAVGVALDAVLFGTAAGTATQPAGLRNAPTVVSPEAGGPDAMAIDLGGLAEATAGVGGDRLVFVGSRARS